MILINGSIMISTKQITISTLKPVTNSDIEFLFELLKERTPTQNISHQTIPTYQEHEEFVKSKGYEKWYIIYNEMHGSVGTIYLTKNNEIGLFVKTGFQKHGYGQQALKLLMAENPRDYYLANINPQNEKSIDFFNRNNFNPYQFTYRFNG